MISSVFYFTYSRLTLHSFPSHFSACCGAPQHGLAVALIPSFEFQQFCFFKTTYMTQLQLAGVPTLPTLFVSKADADARCAAHPLPPGWRGGGGGGQGKAAGSSEGGSSSTGSSEEDAAAAAAAGFSVAVGCTALVPGSGSCDASQLQPGAEGAARAWVAGGVADVADEIVPRLEALARAHWRAPAELELDLGLLFVKSNQMWCREGNRLLRIARVASGGEGGEGKDDDGGSGSGPAAAGAAAAAAAAAAQQPPPLREQLVETLRFMFDECGTSGVQLQPCVMALSGKRPEYRGYFVGGALRAVAATYFRRPENDNTTLGGEIMVVDLGLPAPAAALSGVPFRQVRAVMERAAAVVRDVLALETPVMCRVDVCVDEAAGLVMLTEIEGGLDFSVFPSLIKSFDIRDACCEEVCRRFHAHMDAAAAAAAAAAATA